MSQPPYGNQPPDGGQPPDGANPPPGGSQSGWGQPNPAGQPGFGQPPTAAAPSYGQPQTGPEPGFDQPTQQFAQPPGKKSPLPFVILGLVVLLIAGGVGLFFVLNDDDPTPVASTTAVQPTESTADTDSSTEDTDSRTEDTDTDSPSGDEPNFADSDEFALTFVELMVDGDYDTALLALCEDGRDASDGDGFADGPALAADFFTELGATTITDGRSTDVYPNPDESDRDVVEFDLETDVGDVQLAVSVLEESGNLTICGYDTL